MFLYKLSTCPLQLVYSGLCGLFIVLNHPSPQIWASIYGLKSKDVLLWSFSPIFPLSQFFCCSIVFVFIYTSLSSTYFFSSFPVSILPLFFLFFRWSLINYPLTSMRLVAMWTLQFKRLDSPLSYILQLVRK